MQKNIIINLTTTAILMLLSCTSQAATSNEDLQPSKETDPLKHNFREGSTIEAEAPIVEDQIIPEEDTEKLEELRKDATPKIRRFHEVLNDLLAEFGYDLKSGQFDSLDNLSIRKVSVSSSLPQTYRKYTQLLASEVIRDNTKVKVITCIPCNARTSRIENGKITINSPANNIGVLKTAADRLGINYFMDVVLVYHTTHMVLAFEVFAADGNELVWAKTYNSETVRSKYQKLAVDYKQIMKSRKSDTYQPEYKIQLGIGGGAIPNVGGGEEDASMITLHINAMERFDRRKSEFGLSIPIYLSFKSILKEYPTTSSGNIETITNEDDDTKNTEPKSPAPFTFGVGLYGTYAYNFLGWVESFDEIRHGLSIGIGAFFASGYLAPTARISWGVYFGRRFSLHFGGIYIAPSRILIENKTQETKQGTGFDGVFSYNI